MEEKKITSEVQQFNELKEQLIATRDNTIKLVLEQKKLLDLVRTHRKGKDFEELLTSMDAQVKDIEEKINRYSQRVQSIEYIVDKAQDEAFAEFLAKVVDAIQN